MAEDGPLTPEKQLLKLIEGKAAAAGGAPAGRPMRSAKPALSFGALMAGIKGRLSFFKRRARKQPVARKKFSLNLAMVNRMLMVCAGALFLYLVVDTVASALQLSHPPILSARKEARGQAAAPHSSPLNESAYYLQKVSARDIFKEGGRPEAPVQSEEPAPVEANPLTASLSLVGISWSANPDVIIEDKENKRTYFVKRGQNVGEGVKVEAIFKDHVVLSHDGREFELR